MRQGQMLSVMYSKVLTTLRTDRRTLKYMMGILHGTWIVSDSWVDACTAAGCPVPEDAHEVAGDCNGNQQGPILGRLQKSAKLLHGWEVRSFALLFVTPSRRFIRSATVSAPPLAHNCGHCKRKKCPPFPSGMHSYLTEGITVSVPTYLGNAAAYVSYA